MRDIYDVIIVGAGPAGLTAAIYAQRAGLSTLLLEKSVVSGGQVASTYEVDNYPGLPEVTGTEFGEKIRAHADRLGLESQRSQRAGDPGRRRRNKGDKTRKKILCQDGRPGCGSPSPSIGCKR